MESDIYYINRSWHYFRKSVNFGNFTINYEDIGGFARKEKAEEAKKKDDLIFAKDLERMKMNAGIPYTFQEYIEDVWLPFYVKTTEARTKWIGHWAIKNIILPNIEQDILISYVTADYIDDIIKKCIPICESSGEVTLKFIRRILKDAYYNGLIRSDLRDDIMYIKRKVPHLKLLKKEQVGKLLRYSCRHPSYYFEILMGLFVGLRPGEIYGLRYDDFDVEKKILRVRRQYTVNYAVAEANDQYVFTSYMEDKDPKADSCRTLHIPEFLFGELERKQSFNKCILERRKKDGITELDEEYICLGPKGLRKGKSTLLNSLYKACNSAGVPKISFHTLRHQFATMSLEKGVPLEQISRILGHKSVITTFNKYCGIMDADADVRNTIEQLIPELPSKRRGTNG